MMGCVERTYPDHLWTGVVWRSGRGGTDSHSQRSNRQTHMGRRGRSLAHEGWICMMSWRLLPPSFRFTFHRRRVRTHRLHVETSVLIQLKCCRSVQSTWRAGKVPIGSKEPINEWESLLQADSAAPDRQHCSAPWERFGINQLPFSNEFNI